MDPSTTSYFGNPNIVKNNVLLPAPFGPKSTWVSPSVYLQLQQLNLLLQVTFYQILLILITKLIFNKMNFLKIIYKALITIVITALYNIII